MNFLIRKGKNWFAGKRRVAIDLGSTHIKIAGFQHKQQRYELYFFDMVDLLQEGTLDQPEQDKYQKALKKLLQKHVIEKAQVNCTLPAERAIIQCLILEQSDSETDLMTTIEKELKQSHGDEVEDCQVVYHKLHERDDQMSVIACAMPSVLRDKYTKLLTACDLNLRVLDVDAFAIYNAIFYHFSGPPPEPITVVHMGAGSSLCLAMAPKKTPFFHAISIGGMHLTKKIMDEFGLSLPKAEVLKRRMYRPDRTRQHAYQSSGLNDLLSEYVSQLSKAVKQSILHFQTSQGVSEIARILLTGGGAQISILSNVFEEHLKIKTEIWNPLDMFEPNARDNFSREQIRQGMHLTPAIGAIIRGD